MCMCMLHVHVTHTTHTHHIHECACALALTLSMSTCTPVQVEIYTDLKTEVDTHKDWPTASTCARTIYLPVFAEEQHFLEKLQRALDEFKAKNSSWGGAEFGYA